MTSTDYKGEYPCTITDKGITVFPLAAQSSPVASLKSDDRYPSGLAGLDEMTSGGWLRDAIVLVRGPAGSGKTTLAGMYARAGALRGEKVVYYAFEETKPILMRNFASLNLPLAELEVKGFLSIQCRYPEATSPEDLLVTLRQGLEEDKPSLVVLDSISSIEHSTSAGGFRHFMVGPASLLREHSRSVLMTQTLSETSREVYGVPCMSTIPDAILPLDYSASSPDLDRTLRVLKMRGSAHSAEQRGLVIDKGGLRVAPLPPRVHARGHRVSEV